MMQHIASVAAVEIRHSDLKKTKQKYFKPESKDGSPVFEHHWPKLVFFSSFPKNWKTAMVEVAMAAAVTLVA